MIKLLYVSVPYLAVFFGALILTLILTPVVREMNRALGMVDRPSERRINKTPIPRGGGLALVLGVFVSYSLLINFTGRPLFPGFPSEKCIQMMVLASAVTALGYADDKFGLSPLVKLFGQLVVAFLTWWWVGLGFSRLWPELPVWLDCVFTVFWIVGAINAFNLIDGLDGLASGIALIATLGIAGSLILCRSPQQSTFYFAFAGGLLGFLRYNYNPASVFLGDSGSMFIGFTVSTLPLISQAPNSFLVSVGVPLLAMGVPIFDTSLAIVRRTIRHLLLKREGTVDGNDKVMTADTDHLHHRLLRSSGLNQRRAAWLLYALAAFLVLVGLCGISLESRAAGLWIFALAVGSVIVFRDMARIELFDAGRLLLSVAHERGFVRRRRWARLTVPFYVVYDLAMLTAAFFICAWALEVPLSRAILRVAFPIRMTGVFVFLVFFRTYRTIWARAQVSNFARLFLAVLLGTLASSVACYYAPSFDTPELPAFTLAYLSLAFLFLVAGRFVRSLVRDLFYAIDCSRLKGRKDVSRILVYGSGLRYRAFRRELVRSAAANDRMVVGLLDDDILLRGHYIGGLQVLGTIHQAPEIINSVNADGVVIACQTSPERMSVIREVLRPTGVKVTVFTFNEEEVKTES